MVIPTTPFIRNVPPGASIDIVSRRCESPEHGPGRLTVEDLGRRPVGKSKDRRERDPGWDNRVRLQKEIDHLRMWEQLKNSLRDTRSGKVEGALSSTSRDKKLVVALPWLPLTLEWDERSDSLSHRSDPFQVNSVQLFRGPAESVLQMNPQGVVLVGCVTVMERRTGKVLEEPYQADMKALVKDYLSRLGMHPVFSPNECSKPLLPSQYADTILHLTFHYVTPACQEPGFGSYDWEGYKHLNAAFAEAVLEQYEPSRGDLVTVHDHHLMLLPRLLRERHPDIVIGFYMHTVFPSSEVYRILPEREELLKGILPANVIAFHNFQYARHFLTASTRVLGVECSSSGVEACEEAGGCGTKVVAVPLGIDTKPLTDALLSPDIQKNIEELKGAFKGRKVILAVDTLDQKKGVAHKLLAFHKMLADHPELRDKCVWLQVCLSEDASFLHSDKSHQLEKMSSPESEEGEGDRDAGDSSLEIQDALHKLQHYHRYAGTSGVSAPCSLKGVLEKDSKAVELFKAKVNQLVGDVNAHYGSFARVPVHFLNQPFSVEQLLPLYAIADVVVDTSLRDVLPRVACEFLCCQRREDPGVLVLSEFSGSAQSLRAGAICVNPWDINTFAEALVDALTMEEREVLERHKYGASFVQSHTIQEWAERFLKELKEASEETETERLVVPPRLNHDLPVFVMKRTGGRKLLVLGFLGTLITKGVVIGPRTSTGRGGGLLNENLLNSLLTLGKDELTDVVILSSCSKESLEEAFIDGQKSFPLWLIGENGAIWRPPGEGEWEDSRDSMDMGWLDPVEQIMQHFVDRTPGSFIQKTKCSISWNYPRTQSDYGAVQSKDLMIHLWAGPLLSAPAEVVCGSNSVEVRPTGMSKAGRLERILQEEMARFHAGLPRRVDVESSNRVSTPKVAFSPIRSSSGPPTSAFSMSDELPSPLYDFGCVMGDFLLRDEDVYSVVSKFHSSPDTQASEKSIGPLGVSGMLERADREKARREKMEISGSDPSSPLEGSEEIDEAKLFTCTVGRKGSRAQFLLHDHNDCAFLLAKMAWAVSNADKCAA